MLKLQHQHVEFLHSRVKQYMCTCIICRSINMCRLVIFLEFVTHFWDVYTCTCIYILVAIEVNLKQCTFFKKNFWYERQYTMQRQQASFHWVVPGTPIQRPMEVCFLHLIIPGDWRSLQPVSVVENKQCHFHISSTIFLHSMFFQTSNIL